MKKDSAVKKQGKQNDQHKRKQLKEQKPGIKKPAAHHKGQVIELVVDDLDREGIGVSVKDSRKLLLPGGLPKDRCLAKITHIGARTDHLHLLKLLNPSPLRNKKTICPDAHDCLGCPLIDMRYEEQLRWKHQLVQKELAAYPLLKETTVLPPLAPGKKLQYRTTAKLVIAGSYNNPYIGMYRRATHDLVDLTDCPIHHPLINQVIDVVQNGIKKLRVPIYQPERKTGILRYLVVRVSEESRQAMVTFVTYHRSYNELHHLGKFLQQHLPQVAVICQNVNSSEGTVIFGNRDYFLTKQQTIQENIGGVKMLVSPRSFLQAQHEGARLLYNKVKAWAGDLENMPVLDLYCGIGGIALTLAPVAGKVTGIEISAEAVADARRNAAINNADNCKFEAGDVQELLSELIDEGEMFRLVILNPPRKGAEQKVLKQITDLQPARIIYVSCSPQTLARDLNTFAGSGYNCDKIQPVDLFPQTPHIENIALLTRSTG